MKLYNLSLTVFIFLLWLTSCNNDIDIPEPVDDEPIIQKFIADNNLNAVKSDEWDVYYVELEPGTGEQVVKSNVVEIAYENALLDNTVIDSDTSYIFVPEVYSFITGMALGTLTMQEGGKNLVLIPSKYAYGNNTGLLNGVNVPANSVLQSTITLKDIRTRAEQKTWEEAQILKYIEEQGFDSVSISDEGLYKQILTEGDGEETPVAGVGITVDYEGTFLDGTTFDEGVSAQFGLTANGLIEGFFDGVLTMKRNEEAVFIMVSDIAYGDRGSGAIPPFTPLVFKIKLLAF